MTHHSDDSKGGGVGGDDGDFVNAKELGSCGELIMT